MAVSSALVLSDVLCFVKAKYVTVPIKQLKSALVDFYSVESLSEAKVQLLYDIEAMKSVVSFPHVPRRRDGENRIAREVDDILSVFCRLDEHKLIDSLPQYVSGSPDCMPSIRLFEGDMNVLMIMLDKMHGKIQEFGSALTSINRDVSVLQSKFVSLEQFPPIQSTDLIQPRQPAPQRQSKPQQPPVQSLPEPGGRGHGNSALDETVVLTSINKEGSTSNWAALASTPNRFGPLATASTTDDEGASQPYELVQSRRSKRHRNRTSPQGSARTVENHSQQQQQEQQRRRRPALYGKSTNSAKLVAARKLRKNAVFCIDNVNISCSSDDIKSFVKAQSINVVTCFEVKPRRRRDDTEIADRRAFRLCIHADDRERLLDAAIWPDSVVVSDWYFKPQQNNQQNNQGDEQSKKMRLNDVAVGPTAAAAAAAVSAQVTPATGFPVGDSTADTSAVLGDVGDDTIIAAYNIDNTADNMDCSTSIDHGV